MTSRSSWLMRAASCRRLLDTVEAAGATVKGVDLVQPDLEAVFLHLTGRALRDSAE